MFDGRLGCVPGKAAATVWDMLRRAGDWDPEASDVSTATEDTQDTQES
jgi:hypothetical protein